jgi:hypothetical protein
VTREVRHLIGAAAGLAALPVVYYLTEAGARALRAAYTAFAPGAAGLGYLMAVAAVVLLLAAWSPAAALACGLPLAAVGGLFALDLDAAVALAGRLPWFGSLGAEPPGTLAGVTGLYAVIGLALAMSALLPRRTRSILGG